MKRITALVLCLALLFCMFPAKASEIDSLLCSTAEYVSKTVSEPTVGTVGGEWAVIGLARSGMEIPSEYYEKYFENLEKYVRDRSGILHDKKYTEYSRVILALTAIGKNPEDVAGFNLLAPLGDYAKTVQQGINGAIWALIALDSGDYEIPYVREKYLDLILDSQLEDGGWALSGDLSDADITGMALQALAPYRSDERVAEAVSEAVSCMSSRQLENGGFESGGVENSECCAQMLVAACLLGIAPDDPRFVRNGNSMLDNLCRYYVEGKGFKHTFDEYDSNPMATEQALYALAAVNRFYNGKKCLYDMSDVSVMDDSTAAGLTEKNPDVRKTEIQFPGRTFEDISGHDSEAVIKALAERGIINGKSDCLFEPDSYLTRAEFATVIVKALGLPVDGKEVFADINSSDWFFDYVSTAFEYGIVSGVSATEFNPGGTITREQAAAMVARAAGLCGMDSDYSEQQTRDILAAFSDYRTVSDWAAGGLAFLYDYGIMPDDALEIIPGEFISRSEIAEMLYNLLYTAELLGGNV